MTDVTPLPGHGEVFVDDRGPERALRVSWHQEADVVVFSFWRDVFCVGTFRLKAEDVPAVMGILSRGPQRLQDATQTAPGQIPPTPQTGAHAVPPGHAADPAQPALPPAAPNQQLPAGAGAHAAQAHRAASAEAGPELNPDDFPTEVWNGVELQRRLHAEAQAPPNGNGYHA